MLLLTWVSTSFFQRNTPQLLRSIDAVIAMTKQYFCYSTFGYWKLFDTTEAARLLDSHVSAVFAMN